MDVIEWATNNATEVLLSVLIAMVVFLLVKVLAKFGFAMVPLLLSASGAVIVVWLLFFGGINTLAGSVDDAVEEGIENPGEAPIEFGDG